MKGQEDLVQVSDFVEKWDESYERYENTLFFPSEAIIRFVNKHIRRRIGVDTYTKNFEVPPSILEIGSGSGRHLVFLAQAGFRPTGVELSSIACDQARALLRHEGLAPDAYEIINGSATELPVADGSFDYAVSAATLDSMPTAKARSAIAEIHRALRPGALFFADLIADDVLRPGQVDENGDQLVTERHESGTVQSYFNKEKIDDLFEGFEIREIYKTLTASVDNKISNSRFYVTFEKPR